MSMRLSGLALGAVLFLAGTVLLGMLLTVPLDTFVGRVLVDDALYYLVPAQNFLRGLGTSFDGLNLTNGYHPLWMLFTIAGSWTTPDFLEVYLLPAMSGLFYILGALGLSLFLFPRQSAFAKAMLFAVFAFNFGMLKIFMQGLENGINFFILSAILIFLQNHFAGLRAAASSAASSSDGGGRNAITPPANSGYWAGCWPCWLCPASTISCSRSLSSRYCFSSAGTILRGLSVKASVSASRF